MEAVIAICVLADRGAGSDIMGIFVSKKLLIGWHFLPAKANWDLTDLPIIGSFVGGVRSFVLFVGSFVGSFVRWLVGWFVCWFVRPRDQPPCEIPRGCEDNNDQSNKTSLCLGVRSRGRGCLGVRSSRREHGSLPDSSADCETHCAIEIFIFKWKSVLTMYVGLWLVLVWTQIEERRERGRADRKLKSGSNYFNFW